MPNSSEFSSIDRSISLYHFLDTDSIFMTLLPADTAEPITPATLGPIACISRKFEGFSFCPTTCETLAAIGTAETPAEPISGLIVPPDNLFIRRASNTPDAVPIANAITPSTIIVNV